MARSLRTVGDFYQYALDKGRLHPLIGPQADQLVGGDLAQKADSPLDLSSTGGFRNVMYGAEVMDWVYREFTALTMLPTGMMNKTGFRVDLFDPSTKGYGDADGGTIGDAIGGSDADLQEQKVTPGFVHTPWQVTVEAQALSEVDDGVILDDYNRERYRRIHRDLIVGRLLQNAETAAANATGNTTDAKKSTDTTSANRGLGIEPFDRYVANDAEEDQKGGAQTGWYDVYDGGADRDSGTDYDAQVVPQSGTHGTDAALSLAKVDELLRQTEEQGAQAMFDGGRQILFTGRDTYDDLKDRVGPNWRIDMEEVEAAVNFGEGLAKTATKRGANITFGVRTYEGRPIVRSKGVPSDGASRLYALNLGENPNGETHDGMVWQWLIPTLFLDGQSNWVLQNFLGNESLYFSSGRLLDDAIRKQGKLTDLE